MASTVPNKPPLDHFQRGDQVARAFGLLTGRTHHSAHVWLHRSHNQEVALALRAHREVGAWGRRESWAAPLVAELQQIGERELTDDFILEHLASDQLDDNWRVHFLNYRTTDSRRQWCRALARFHALNLSMMVALKKD